MQATPEETLREVCRTCLQKITSSSGIFHVSSICNSNLTLHDKLKFFLPEFDFHFTPNAIICRDCVSIVDSACKFKNRFIYAEECIQMYIQQTGFVSDDVDLLQVVEMHKDLDSNFENTLKAEYLEVTEHSLDDSLATICNASAEHTQMQLDYDDHLQATARIKTEFEITKHSLEEISNTSFCSTTTEEIEQERLEIVDMESMFCNTDTFISAIIEENKSNQSSCASAELPIQVKSHKRTKKETKSHTCVTCGLNCKTKLSLHVHMRKHPNEKLYECKECRIAFKKKTNLNIHLRLHTGEKTYKCGLCGDNATCKVALREHMKSHVKGAPFKCDQCDFSTSEQRDVNEHLKLHAKEKPCKCRECNCSRVYKNDKSYKDIHIENIEYKCTVCGYNAITTGLLHMHMKRHQ